MKNKIHKYDFLIIGAGLIGALAGLELIKKNFKVLVVEKNKQALLDKRTLAVNANSREFLSTLGLWDGLGNEPIKQIIIQDEINSSPLKFEHSKESMGSVVYNKDLLTRARVKLKQNRALLEHVNIELETINTEQSVKLNNRYYFFKKIIVSVGRKYSLNTLFKKYKFNSTHSSFVGFFNHTKKHDNKAYEIFTTKGPLAVLPAPNKNKNFSTFIYSTIEPINKNEIKKTVKKFFYQSHGQIDFMDSFKSFKIFPYINTNNNKNIFLLGDSFRSIHPVAGQGWNLGIKDIQTLSNLLDQYGINDENITSIYYAKRKIESSAYLTFTNTLNRLYENSDKKINKILINIGFQSLLTIKPLRRIFIEQAMGRASLI